MLRQWAHNWWALALRGAVAVLFGLLAFIWPGVGLLTLVFLFGIYAVADGVLAVAGAVQAREANPRWWVLLLEGLISLAAGVIAFVLPGIAAFALVYVIAAWAIVTGIVEVVAAIRLREEIRGEWLLGLSGLLSVLFGVLVVLAPAAGALTVVWLVAAYALLFGVLLIVLAFRLRGLQQRLEPTPGAP